MQFPSCLRGLSLLNFSYCYSQADIGLGGEAGQPGGHAGGGVLVAEEEEGRREGQQEGQKVRFDS